jgi:hypothetical protein
MKRIEGNLLKLQKEVEEGLYRYRSDHIDIEVIIFIHTITIFQITLKSFLGGVKGTF